jgi:hypothetical protein
MAVHVVRTNRRRCAASASVGALTIAAALIAAPAATAGAGADNACPHSIPLLKAKITGSDLTFDGSLTQPAGPLRIRLKAVGDEREIALQRFKGDYGPADLKHDVAAAFGSGTFDQAALRRAEKHTVALGGVDAAKGKSATMTVVLKPGTYYLNDDSGDVPIRFRKLHIRPSSCGLHQTRTTATVTMKETHRFGGDTTLPAEGSILVKNVSTSFDELHFLSMQRVKKGTTRADVLAAFGSSTPGPPPFFLDDQVGTDALSPGKSQALTYSLPKGTYALLCFFPDLKDGVPHAFTGMVRIVHLK